MTALPLTSLAVAANGSVAGSPLVQLYLLTLNVPTLDFLALLTLATDRLNGTSNSSSGVRRCMEMDVLVHAARLQPFIQVRCCADGSKTQKTARPEARGKRQEPQGTQEALHRQRTDLLCSFCRRWNGKTARGRR